VKGVVAALALAATVSGVSAAKADDVQFNISGAGVTASGTLYGSYVTVFGFSDPLFEATGATGYFTDSTSGVHGTINGVYPGSAYTSVPSNGNHDSINAVGVPFPPASYDNIIYVKGNSPVVCDPTFYPYHGGFMDIYGVMLTVDTGAGTGLVNVWSNGNLNDPSNPIGPDYGLSDGMLTMIGTTPTFNVLNYIGNGNNYPAYSGSGLQFSAHTPEPSAAAVFTIGLLTLPAIRLRKRFKKSA
jgi:hypothetical protein